MTAGARVTGMPSWAIDRMTELCTRHVSSRFGLDEGQVIREKNRLIYLSDRTEKARWDFKIEEIGILPDVFDKNSLYLDPAKLKGRLRFRTWVRGDRIMSKGLSGSQLVSDILKDAGIPFSERSEIQVLTDGVDILWIPGLKVSRTALAAPTSAKIWRIFVVKP